MIVFRSKAMKRSSINQLQFFVFANMFLEKLPMLVFFDDRRINDLCRTQDFGKLINFFTFIHKWLSEQIDGKIKSLLKIIPIETFLLESDYVVEFGIHLSNHRVKLFNFFEKFIRVILDIPRAEWLERLNVWSMINDTLRTNQLSVLFTKILDLLILVDLALILLRSFVLLVKHIHNSLVDFQRISVDHYLAAAFYAKTKVLVLYVFLRAF